MRGFNEVPAHLLHSGWRVALRSSRNSDKRPAGSPQATAFEVSANYAATRHPFHAFRRARDIQPTLLARADEAIEWGSPLLRGSNYGSFNVISPTIDYSSLRIKCTVTVIPP
jgi:hypothetical protein